MSTDRLKEELSWLRTVFPVVVALDAGLITYLAHPNTSLLMFRLAVALVTIMLGISGAIIVRVYRALRALEQHHER